MKQLRFGLMGLSLSGAAVAANLRDVSADNIIGSDNLEAIEATNGTTYYETSRAVARVESGGGGFCTAFRVAPDLFMTNFHCAQFKPCAQTMFHLGYEKNLPTEKQIYFQCKEVIAAVERYDMALYRVQRKASPAIDDYPSTALTRASLKYGDKLFMPSHAGTFQKKIDRSDECIVTGPNPYDYFNRRNIAHTCDSESGSSGAPILLKSNHAAVGLHWGGTDVQAGEDTNHGILMKDILGYLDQNAPSVIPELTIK